MTKRLKANVALLAVGGALAAGCTTSTSFVNYDEREMYSGETAGNIQFLEIGAVRAEENGFVWTACDQLVSDAADELRDAAREVGGNAIIHTRWLDYDSGEWERQPNCTTGWGWFALGGVGGLHPWVKRTAVEGIAVYADEDQLKDLRERIDEQRALLVEEDEEDEEAWEDGAEAEDAAAEEDADGEDEDE